MASQGSGKNLLLSIFGNKCPHCRNGNLFTNPNPYNFKTMMDMPEKCPNCGQKFELQTGFYFGTGYVSYALSFIYTVLCLIGWWFTVGIGIRDNRVFYWLAFNSVTLILIQPLIQRLARSIWIALFVRYDKNTNQEHQTI